MPPPQRRGKLITIAVIAIVFFLYYYSGEGNSVQNQQFYKSTLEAMREQEAARHSATKEKIKEAMARPQAKTHDEGFQKVEKPAIPKSHDKTQEEQELEEISIAGRTKMTVPKKGSQDALAKAELDVGSPPKQKTEPKTDEQIQADERRAREAEAKSELNLILKKAPVVIFSKSYCPHSKKAKHILLEGYEISPKPLVVELDQHRLGVELQSLLGETTGRRTVPNILVSGKSIGGGDTIASLDQSDNLASTLKQYGGKWLTEVSQGPGKSP